MTFHDEATTMLKAIDPADGLGDRFREDSPASQALLASILAEIDRPVATEPRRPARFALVVAGSAALAGATALIITAGPGQPLGTEPAAAALHELAIAARAHRDSDPPLQDGEYYYERTEGFGRREEWISSDGILYVSGQEFDGIERSGYLGGAPGVYATFGDARLSYQQTLDLPRDPDRLYEFMAAHAPIEPGDPNALPANKSMFFTLREFLIATPLPADLRAAFYDAAAKIPGIELLGEIRTENGQLGLGIGMWRSGGPDDPNPPETAEGLPITQREDLIFDSETGAIIGDRTVVRGNAHGEAVTASGIVDQIGERPGEPVARAAIQRQLERGRAANRNDGRPDSAG